MMMHNGHMILDKKGKEKEDMAIDDILTYLMKSVLNVAINTGDFEKNVRKKRRTYDGKENRTVSQSKF